MPDNFIYAVTSDVDDTLETAFNAWYNSEHVVELLAVPGFLAARRFRAIDGNPRYLAVYNLSAIDVLETYAFQRIRPTHPDSTPACKEMWSHVKNWKRGAYEEQLGPMTAGVDSGDAEFLYLAAYDLDPAADEEYADWYRSEHLPGVSLVAGVVGLRSFRVHPDATGHLLGEPPRCMLLYNLADAQVYRSDAWSHWQQTPWTRRLKRLSNSSMRNFYERIYPRRAR